MFPVSARLTLAHFAQLALSLSLSLCILFMYSCAPPLLSQISGFFLFCSIILLLFYVLAHLLVLCFPPFYLSLVRAFIILLGLPAHFQKLFPVSRSRYCDSCPRQQTIFFFLSSLSFFPSRLVLFRSLDMTDDGWLMSRFIILITLGYFATGFYFFADV